MSGMQVWRADCALIFTDGACTGNPGPGGWGAVILTPQGYVYELGDSHPSTTNNRMELAGAIHALMRVKDYKGRVWLYTDSTYLIRGITQWIHGWRKKRWVASDGKDVQNRDLWESLQSVVMDRPKGSVDWRYVRGHKGVPGNERCDEIAVGFSQGKRLSLYQGSLTSYPVAITDLPDPEPLPEMKKSNEKKPPPHSYLSLVNGVIERHTTWKECEARVKGRPGAKFKKAATAKDEIEILAGWGYSADRLPK